jgi:hypothetical protein
LALDFRRRAISKRALYATEANSVFNLAAKTATMDAGYGEVLDSNHNPLWFPNKTPVECVLWLP